MATDKVRVDLQDSKGHPLCPPILLGADELPPLRVGTLLDLGGAIGEVVSVEPADKDAAVRGGRLALRLRLHMRMAELHTLPTVDAAPPQLVPASGSGALLELLAEDWRQAELLSAKHQATARQYLDEVRAIYATAMDGGSFQRVLEREIYIPIDSGELPLSALQRCFSVRQPYHGVGFRQTAGTIPNAFAFQSGGGLLVYGLVDGPWVRCCSLEVERRGPSLADDGAALADLMELHGLLLVDWCSGLLMQAQDEQYRAYFRPDGHGYVSRRRSKKARHQ